MGELLEEVGHVRERAEADRPSPAIPLLLLALVVTGALTVALVRLGSVQVLAGESPVISGSDPTSLPSSDSIRLISGSAYMPFDDPGRLAYWVIASIVAYVLAIWIARRQGYRGGVWVDRLPLAMGGLAALLVSVIVVAGWYAPADLLIRGNVPLLAIAVGIVVWAVRERRPGLWVVAAVIAPLSVLANLYDMENVLFRIGVPYFDNAEEIANLGLVAAVLFVAAATFGLLHRRDTQALPTRSER